MTLFAIGMLVGTLLGTIITRIYISVVEKKETKRGN